MYFFFSRGRHYRLRLFYSTFILFFFFKLTHACFTHFVCAHVLPIHTFCFISLVFFVVVLNIKHIIRMLSFFCIWCCLYLSPVVSTLLISHCIFFMVLFYLFMFFIVHSAILRFTLNHSLRRAKEQLAFIIFLFRRFPHARRNASERHLKIFKPCPVVSFKCTYLVLLHFTFHCRTTNNLSFPFFKYGFFPSYIHFLLLFFVGKNKKKIKWPGEGNMVRIDGAK